MVFYFDIYSLDEDKVTSGFRDLTGENDFNIKNLQSYLYFVPAFVCSWRQVADFTITD